MDLTKFKIIDQANQISEEIWELIIHWKHFEKETIGKQLVRAADSISANLSESYGRYSFADRKRFVYYARGSLCETLNWLEKSINRGLIDDRAGQDLLSELQILSHRINSYIRKVNNH